MGFIPLNTTNVHYSEFSWCPPLPGSAALRTFPGPLGAGSYQKTGMSQLDIYCLSFVRMNFLRRTPY